MYTLLLRNPTNPSPVPITPPANIPLGPMVNLNMPPVTPVHSFVYIICLIIFNNTIIT